MNTASLSLSDIKQGLSETNDLFNSGKRNFEALDLIYTADARILPPGESSTSTSLLAFPWT
jgi:hypothetical protein